VVLLLTRGELNRGSMARGSLSFSQFILSLVSKSIVGQKKNINFMCSRRDFVAMGGGSNFGLWMDSDFERGSSTYCETFDNPCLASSEDFQIIAVEVWGFSEPTSPEIVQSDASQGRLRQSST